MFLHPNIQFIATVQDMYHIFFFSGLLKYEKDHFLSIYIILYFDLITRQQTMPYKSTLLNQGLSCLCLLMPAEPDQSYSVNYFFVHP